METETTTTNTKSFLNHKTSVLVLEEICRRWVLARFGSNPWLPNLSLSNNSPPPGKGPLHVVLMGDFVSQILKYEKWPRRPMHLWVLSTAVKNVLVQLFGFPENSVGVIPRYELFPIKKRLRPFPSIDSEWTMIFGGRIVPSKNLDFALRTVSFLQNEFGQKVNLKCFGPIGNQARLNLHEGLKGSFEERIRSLCENLPFKMKPEFLPAQSGKQWLEGKNSVCISFSSFHMEDLGVSIAQAQTNGMPCIMTEWGGHADVVGSNIFKFPIHYLGEPSESSWIQDGRSFALAHDIVNFQKSLKAKTKIPRPALTPLPDVVGIKTLMTSIQNLEKAYSKMVNGLFKDHNWDFILRNDLGKAYFANYNKIFGKTNDQVKHTIALQPSKSADPIALPSLELSWAAAQSRTHKVTFGKPPKVFDCDNIVDLRPSVESFKFLNHLRNGLKSQARLIFNVHELASNAFYPAYFNHFSKVFRAGDLFLTSCSADKKILKGLIQDAQTQVTQVPVGQLLQRPDFDGSVQLIHVTDPNMTCFYYCGPIREESNLHNIFFALKLFKARNPHQKFRLEIYPTDLGSSSRNIESLCRDFEYENHLKELSAILRVRYFIHWQAFKPMEIVHLQKNVKRVFISASLRTDECLAPFAQTALAFGDTAILSSWGAHQDLSKQFGGRVKAVKVKTSPKGPAVSPMDLLRAMEEVATEEKYQNRKPPPVQFTSTVGEIKNLISSPLSSKKPKPTKLFAKLTGLRNQRCNEAFSEGRTIKSNLLLESYQDLNADFFFSAYGMTSEKNDTKDLTNFLNENLTPTEAKRLAKLGY
jgi:hypothetical protein